MICPKCSALDRCISALRWSASVETVYALLKSCGLTDYEAWLIYRGALLITKSNP